MGILEARAFLTSDSHGGSKIPWLLTAAQLSATVQENSTAPPGDEREVPQQQRGRMFGG